jgi:hypothetical protein
VRVRHVPQLRQVCHDKGVAPRLRARRQRELGLIANAQSHNWEREVQRHQGSVQRIEQLLAALGEPVEYGNLPP